ncbi:MAG: protein-glutamate O-methyltransferase CheR [Nitrospirota bacterium]
MTNEEFLLFRNLIYNECGMYFKENKKDFVEKRVRRRLKTKNFKSIYQYYKHVTDNGNGKSELLELLDELTINETSFFRNKPQFDLFREKVMPEIIERKLKDGSRGIKIWSAGCSTGEEVYTIAMEGLEAIERHCKGMLTQPALEIIGSDISLSVLKVAKEGVYPKKKLADIDEHYVKKYFCADGDFYIVSMDVKKYTIFDFHNLKFENGLKDVDIIFCRNVMIYFDMAEQERVIDKFHSYLRPEGYLFVGHSETLQGLNDNFRFVYHNKGTAYKRK